MSDIVKHAGGRPTDYTPELGEKILQLMAVEGLSLAAAAGECNIYRQRVYDWVAIYPEFSDTINLAKSKRQLFLERRLLRATEGPVVTSTIFALKNGGQGDWLEKSDTTTTHNVGDSVLDLIDAVNGKTRSV